MFRISAKFELSTVIAESDDGKTWSVRFSFDEETSEPIKLNADQMAAVMQFQLHPDGEPLNHGMLRALIEPELASVPRHLWPMP